jgi:hypothetical protein
MIAATARSGHAVVVLACSGCLSRLLVQIEGVELAQGRKPFPVEYRQAILVSVIRPAPLIS